MFYLRLLCAFLSLEGSRGEDPASCFRLMRGVDLCKRNEIVLHLFVSIPESHLEL